MRLSGSRSGWLRMPVTPLLRESYFLASQQQRSGGQASPVPLEVPVTEYRTLVQLSAYIHPPSLGCFGSLAQGPTAPWRPRARRRNAPERLRRSGVNEGDPRERSGEGFWL